MEKSERLRFIVATERMVSPKKVASIFQGAEMLRKLPKSLQKKIMESGTKRDPYIGFIVEPYSFFLAYGIADEKALGAMLPEDYELADASIFQDSRERPCVILGAFNVHTSVFWGNRLELYVIARNNKSGLLSWIIHEYVTNTISYDPGRGFIGPSSRSSVLTTSFLGELILDVESEDSTRRIKAAADIKKGEFRPLSKRLWIEGNLSVDYGGDLGDAQTKPFGLVFDPGEMGQALSIPARDAEIAENTFLDGIIEKEPFEICCFPFAQHFYTTSSPKEHSMRNEGDLERQIRDIIRGT
jgi:hypothetical protein